MKIPAPPGIFSLKKTFECGQCFRFDQTAPDSYLGIALGRPIRLERFGDKLELSCGEDEYETFWKDYFDMGSDYEAMSRTFGRDSYFQKAAEFGRGIRILRQDPWEALCSFIISQCNNIPRIKGIIARLCELCGDPVGFEGSTLYSFPSAGRVAALSLDELSFLRCGYRAGYIRAAAEAVRDGFIDRVIDLPSDELRARLTEIRGVGTKVADCALLFGFHRMEAFPQDVWIKREIKEKGIDPRAFGEYAGLAQQYIFYYAREGVRN